MKLLTGTTVPIRRSRTTKKSAVRPTAQVEPLTTLVRKTLLTGVPAKDIAQALRTLRHERQALTHACKRRGRAKGGGQSSKAKGRAAVVMVRDLLLRTFKLQEDDALVKATSMGGCDLHLSPHAQSYFPFAIEVKSVEALSIWSALAQADINAKKKNVPPVVFFKRAHSPMYVTFKAQDLLAYIQRE